MPGFNEHSHNNQTSNKMNFHITNTIDEISDDLLQDLINTALKGRHDEDIIWISLELLNFKDGLKGGLKKRHNELNNLRHFSDFNDLKQQLFIILKKIKSEENIRIFFKIIESNKNTFSKTLIDIKNDKRICTFLFNYLNERNRNYFQFNYEKNIYMYLVHWYFTIDLHTNRKDHLIDKALTIFNKEIKTKRRNHHKKLEDKAFTDWIYEYLEKTDNCFSQTKYIQTNHKNDQLFITTYLDYTLHYNNENYENTMNKINKAWSQKKFRNGNKVKNPYHIPLTKKSKEELAKLSEFKNLSESDILEELIHQMFRNEMCDENGKSKY